MSAKFSELYECTQLFYIKARRIIVIIMFRVIWSFIYTIKLLFDMIYQRYYLCGFLSANFILWLTRPYVNYVIEIEIKLCE